MPHGRNSGNIAGEEQEQRDAGPEHGRRIAGERESGDEVGDRPPGLCRASTPRLVPRMSAIVIAVATSSTVGTGLSAMSYRTGALM